MFLVQVETTATKGFEETSWCARLGSALDVLIGIAGVTNCCSTERGVQALPLTYPEMVRFQAIHAPLEFPCVPVKMVSLRRPVSMFLVEPLNPCRLQDGVRLGSCLLAMLYGRTKEQDGSRKNICVGLVRERVTLEWLLHPFLCHQSLSRNTISRFPPITIVLSKDHKLSI